MEEKKLLSAIPVKPQLVALAKIFSEATSLFIFLAGALVLIGWVFKINIFTTASPYFAPMNLSAALGSVFFGISLWLLQEKRLGKWARALGRGCAVAVFILGVATFIEYAFGWSLFTNQSIFQETLATGLVYTYPGRAALGTALIFIFLGPALFFLDTETRRRVRPAQILSVLAGVVAVVAIIGYVYDIAAFYMGVQASTPMSIYAAVIFFTFHFGVLAARPESGFVRVAVAAGAIGTMFRTLFPLAFVLPLVLSWLLEYGEHTGLYGMNFSMAMGTTVDIIIFSAVVLLGILVAARREGARLLIEEKLLKNEKKYHDLVDVMEEGLGIQDKNGIITFMNRRGCEMLGYKWEELVGKPTAFVFDKENQKILREQMSKRRKGERQSYEIEWLRKDGKRISTIIAPSPIFDDKGDFAGSVAVFTDITERKKAEEEIKKARALAERSAKDLEKFKMAVDGASDHIIITDPSGIVLYGNKAMETITGYTIAEAVGQKAGHIWGGRMPKEFYEKLWHTIKVEKRLFTGEMINTRKNGEIYTAELRIVPILDKNGEIQFFVGIERDITKMKEVEQMKTDFVSFTSHQLRTPLTVIKWNSEMLKNVDNGKLTREQKRYLAEIGRGEERMAQLISALLNISRLESGRLKIEPKSADIIAAISDAISEATPFARAKNCSIKFSKPDRVPPPVNLDAVLFKQVVSSLLGNATRYSPPKKCSIELVLKEAGEYYQIDVIDEGIGIPVGVQNRIFTKFFRAENATKYDTEGTGLGLYITKLIVETSGGKIWFESTEGKGTVFHFTVPKSGMRAMAGEKELAV